MYSLRSETEFKEAKLKSLLHIDKLIPEINLYLNIDVRFRCLGIFYRKIKKDDLVWHFVVFQETLEEAKNFCIKDLSEENLDQLHNVIKMYSDYNKKENKQNVKN